MQALEFVNWHILDFRNIIERERERKRERERERDLILDCEGVVCMAHSPICMMMASRACCRIAI